MRTITSVCMVFALMASTSLLLAGELKSGLQPGKFIGAFDVTKCAGAESDGVAIGKSLCYRCKYGGRPMVMVFTRSQDETVSALVSALDKTVGANKDAELAAFVNVLSSDVDEAEKSAKSLGAKSENVPVVVPVETENGPGDYGLNPKADVTVIIAKGGKVQANHAFGKGELKKDGVAAILADVEKLVN